MLGLLVALSTLTVSQCGPGVVRKARRWLRGKAGRGCSGYRGEKRDLASRDPVLERKVHLAFVQEVERRWLPEVYVLA